MRLKLLVLAIVSAVALVVLTSVAAAPYRSIGTALVAGPVLLNGHPMSGPSLSLSDGDRLETGARGGAIITLSKTDAVTLSENSAVRLSTRKSGLAAELDRGRVLVTSSHDRLRELRLAGEAVSIRAAPGKPRQYQVSRLPDGAYVMAKSGNVTIFDEGYATTTEVPEGKVGAVRPEAEPLQAAQRPAQGQRTQRPQTPQRPATAPAAAAPAAKAGGQTAGQITAAIPKDYIIRGAQQTEGNAGDKIAWEDLLRTEPRGRVRVKLDDGSILNVGSDSRLRVVRHDAASQVTELEMKYGRLRAQVVKLGQPNSKFEIRTNTAICGVLGTDFYLEATERSTRVVVFAGVVKMTPLVAGALAGIAAGTAGQASTVGAGQASTAAAGSVSTPATATVSQIQNAVTATTATQTATQAAVMATNVSRVAVVAATAAPPAAVAAVAVPTFTESASPSKP